MAIQFYEYQKRVARAWRKNCNLVLQAPTGAGKTIAALWPFLEAFDARRAGVPTKCIYVVPMRVLAHQFVLEMRKWTSELALIHQPRITIQTGDAPEDRRFEGDLIFCTVDQFLSSYLTAPYSLPHTLANLNAGAMVGAYIVCDEFHLFDPSSTLPSMLYALRQLSRISPVTVMTATFSESLLQALADDLHAEVERLPRTEALAIDTRAGAFAPRQRKWRTASSPLSAQAVLDLHHKRSLALCNTVRGAQTLYRELRDHPDTKQRGIEVRLLHSRFLQDDRRETEDWLRARFGKDAERDGSLIVVATQTIEVGVDVTCETLHTQLAPASALIQRAGRCARYPGEQGDVIVYPVESYMPYASDKDDDGGADWKTEMQQAFAWVSEHAGEVFDFETEQALVNAVATPRDERIVRGLSAGQPMRESAIVRALMTGDVDTRLLVRDADSRQLLIHPDPDTLLENPFGATGFNLQPQTLYGMVNEWLKRSTNAPWRVMGLRESDDKSEDNRNRNEWQPITSTKEVATARVIVVHPALAGYLKDEGFVADIGNTDFVSALPPQSVREGRSWESNAYQLESYEEHIRLVLQAFKDIALPELAQPAWALENAAKWERGSVVRAAWLACLLHDVGKLSVGWQAWARAYQHAIGQTTGKDFAAAHTLFDWNNTAHRAAEQTVRRTHKRPRHAGESALACCHVIARAMNSEPLTRAVITAIARHHAPFAEDCTGFVLEEPGALRHIRATLSLVPGDVSRALDVSTVMQTAKGLNEFGTLLCEPQHNHAWLAYTLIARALRRADQEGTARGTQHF